MSSRPRTQYLVDKRPSKLRSNPSKFRVQQGYIILIYIYTRKDELYRYSAKSTLAVFSSFFRRIQTKDM